MPSFNEFISALRENIGTLAETTFGDFPEAALRDGNAFVDELREDLERWTTLVVQGLLTREDFQFLVMAKRDLAELEALRQQGLLLVRLERFRSGLIETIVSTAFSVLL